jgi:adenine-specific DNA-methyltransferase
LLQTGRLVFVVPASWLVLDDFVRLREYLASSRDGCLSTILGKVFPKRNVSVVVLALEKGGRGLALYDGEQLAVEKPAYNGEMIRFETPELLQMEQ